MVCKRQFTFNTYRLVPQIFQIRIVQAQEWKHILNAFSYIKHLSVTLLRWRQSFSFLCGIRCVALDALQIAFQRTHVFN